MRASVLAISLLTAAGTLSSGCGGKAVDPADPSSMLKDAEDDIKNDHYQLAVDKLRSIKNKYPYSKYSLEAQIRLADVYFLQESWTEAAAAYESFRDLHPKHERTAYVLFRIAKSYFNDVPDPVARDLGPAQKGIDAYADFLRRFPQDANAPEATRDEAKLRQTMASKELYVGDFYYKRKDWWAAKGRYEKLVGLYSDTAAAESARQKLSAISELAEREHLDLDPRHKPAPTKTRDNGGGAAPPENQMMNQAPVSPAMNGGAQ